MCPLWVKIWRRQKQSHPELKKNWLVTKRNHMILLFSIVSPNCFQNRISWFIPHSSNLVLLGSFYQTVVKQSLTSAFWWDYLTRLATWKPEWLKRDLLMHLSDSVLGKHVRLCIRAPSRGGADMRGCWHEGGGAEIQGALPSANWDSVCPHGHLLLSFFSFFFFLNFILFSFYTAGSY